MSRINVIQRNNKKKPDAFLSALLEGRAADAGMEFDRAQKRGWSVLRLYLEMLTPALRTVGDLWEQGRIGVAQEHRAVQITLEILGRIRSDFGPGAAGGKRILVTTPPGESHWVGARMAADLFELNGLAVDFLGPDTPARDVVNYVQQRGQDLVALSVTIPGALKGTRSVILALRRAHPKLPVLLGGLASGAARSWKTPGRPDAIVEDPLQGFTEACRLLRLDRGRVSFATLLKKVGRRIEALRKERGWSQQELANRTSLDRTYISALEGGKQNATIKVLVKVSEAFAIPLDSLFGE